MFTDWQIGYLVGKLHKANKSVGRPFTALSDAWYNGYNAGYYE